MRILGFLLSLSSLFLGVAITPTCSQSETLKPQKHVAIFVFGDSIYDVGNNNYLDLPQDKRVNFPPHGVTYFKYPTGRASDGLLISDFIALYANLSIWRPYMDPENRDLSHGANFASCAAGVFAYHSEGVLDLETQFRLFKNATGLLRGQLGDKKAAEVVRNAVYLINIGGVDYFEVGRYHKSTESSRLQLVKWVTGNLTNVIKEIYDTGGRKFAFQGLIPMGCTPQCKQVEDVGKYECLEYMSSLSMLHNSALADLCMELESQLPGFKYSILKAYEPFLDRVKNPEKYGFKVSYMACCGKGKYRAGRCGQTIGYKTCDNPDDYLFWDASHPTQHCYSQFAEMFWNGSSNTTWPINLRQLFELDHEETEIFPADDKEFYLEL